MDIIVFAGIAFFSLVINAVLIFALIRKQKKNRFFRNEGFPSSRKFLSGREKKK